MCCFKEKDSWSVNKAQMNDTKQSITIIELKLSDYNDANLCEQHTNMREIKGLHTLTGLARISFLRDYARGQCRTRCYDAPCVTYRACSRKIQYVIWLHCTDCPAFREARVAHLKMSIIKKDFMIPNKS